VLGSQMMVIGILVITFTVLPYQTNALVGVLSEANPYATAAYSPAAKGRHVAVTGAQAAARVIGNCAIVRASHFFGCRLCMA
jgi:hypothetical protein